MDKQLKKGINIAIALLTVIALLVIVGSIFLKLIWKIRSIVTIYSNRCSIINIINNIKCGTYYSSTGSSENPRVWTYKSIKRGQVNVC